MIEWNNLDAKIFEKSNQTFWEKYNKIPDLERLETEFKAETGNLCIYCVINLYCHHFGTFVMTNVAISVAFPVYVAFPGHKN